MTHPTRSRWTWLYAALLACACSSGKGSTPEACLETCCDEDGDGYGRGATCLGADCDDRNPAVFPGAPERCDGVDNDCAPGGLDVSPIDCAPSSCEIDGGVHYVHPAEVCTAGTCVPQARVSCGSFACTLDAGIAACAATCDADDQCAAGAHCSASVCVPDVVLGGACLTANDCEAGLFCADGVCCASACDGICERCDLAGTVGTCAAIPAGQDPDAECPGVSCSAYYWGWSGDLCLRKADVSAAQATCSGARSCRTQAQECAAQTSAGPIAVTCDATCQDPSLTTCAGTTAGTCTNLNLGNQTCGAGVCQVTVARCVNGSPNTCTPNWGAQGAETCNGLDDDCDGTVDDGAFADAMEPNDSCAAYTALPPVGSDQTRSTTATVYPSGDLDVFLIRGTETDSSCTCCDFWCTDEDFKLTVSLAVPSGAGAYRFCAGAAGALCSTAANSCQTVAGGTTASWIYSLDGGCPGTDTYDVYVTVQGGGTPGYACNPYTLTYAFDAGLCLN